MVSEQFSPIETERLLLRRFEARDAAPFFVYRTLPIVALYQSERWLSFTKENAEAFVNEQSKNNPGIPDTWFQIAIELKDTGALIGDIGLHTLPDIRQVEIGYTIDPQHQHHGYALEAVRALLGYLFAERTYHRVIAVVDTRNETSVRLLDKLGMRLEGCFIKSVWDKGMYIDEYQYASLYEEYMKAEPVMK